MIALNLVNYHCQFLESISVMVLVIKELKMRLYFVVLCCFFHTADLGRLFNANNYCVCCNCLTFLGSLND